MKNADSGIRTASTGADSPTPFGKRSVLGFGLLMLFCLLAGLVLYLLGYRNQWRIAIKSASERLALYREVLSLEVRRIEVVP